MAAPHNVTSAFAARPFATEPPASDGSSPGGRRAPAFAPLLFPEWKYFAQIAEVADSQIVGPRRTLFMQSDPRSPVLVIRKGMVKLSRVEPDGSEFIVGLRSDGWLLDAASIMLNRPASSTAVTLTPCTIFRVSRDSFLRLLNGNPGLMWDLTRLISREVQAEREQQIEFRSGSAQGRLNRLASELPTSSAEENPIDQLPLKRLEIARLLAISPEHLSRLMRA